MIAEFLDAANIAEVVWIDDFFATLSRDDAVNRIGQHLAAAKDRGLAVTDIPHVGAVDITKTSAEIEEASDTLLTELAEADVLDVEARLAVLVGARVAEATAQPDLAREEFAALKAAFGARLTTFSVGQWTAEGVARYAAPGPITLFVIDKEFSREKPGFDGLRLLKDLLPRGNSYCIILTHTCTPDQQDAGRLSFAATAGVDPHQFGVVSKVHATGASVDQTFGRAIFEVFARFLTGQLAHLLAQAVATATTDAVKEISSESIYDIDHAIFENSIAEGTSEIDDLLRFFRARQKPKVSAVIRTSQFQSALRQMRDFRAKILALRDQLGTPKIELKAFRGWRCDEVFEDGATLNLLHSPLACGDLFDVTLIAEQTKRYILLVQPCALSVRGRNGKRSGQVGMLVPICEVEQTKKSQPGAAAPAAPEEEEDDQHEDSPYKFFDVKGVMDGQKIWRVDFRSTMYVPLKVLDLAAFNSNGRVQILRDHPEPAVILPPGWKISFDKARRWFPPAKAHAEPGKLPFPKKPPSALGKGADSIEPDITSTSIIYPMSRSGRVATTVADAIYAAWAVYQTRAAFDHDFAKLGDDEDSDPDTPRPDRPAAAPPTAAPVADIGPVPPLTETPPAPPPPPQG